MVRAGDVSKGALRSNWVVAIKVKTSQPTVKRKTSSSSPSSPTRRRHNSLSDKQIQRGPMDKNHHSHGKGFDIEEVHFLMLITHERVVMFLGCGMDREEPDDGAFIVMEYMDEGSLDKPLWFSNDPKMYGCLPGHKEFKFCRCCRSLGVSSFSTQEHSSRHQESERFAERVISKEQENIDDDREYHNITRRAKLADFNVSKIFSEKKRRHKKSILRVNESDIRARRAADWIDHFKLDTKAHLVNPGAHTHSPVTRSHEPRRALD